MASATDSRASTMRLQDGGVFRCRCVALRKCDAAFSVGKKVARACDLYRCVWFVCVCGLYRAVGEGRDEVDSMRLDRHDDREGMGVGEGERNQSGYSDVGAFSCLRAAYPMSVPDTA
eukprot:3678228-Rhodomonas_salina.3